MRFFKYSFMATMTVCHGYTIQEPPFCSEILEYIQNGLPHYGILRNSEGFVYVDLDDAYIHKLIRFIKKDGFEEPPYFGNDGLVGAHISVIYPGELNQVSAIEECGEIVYFSPESCKIVQPPHWKAGEEVYFVVVEVPKLDSIREKYGLPKREYDFHITIGVKHLDVKPGLDICK